MNTFAPKHQRLVLVLVAVVALIAATLLAIWALRSQASYFYVPADIAASPPPSDHKVRLGGMVQKGSLKTDKDGVTLHFVVEDGEASVPVKFRGIAPALFVEGSGVVAEGTLGQDGTFVADNLLAKHDENYVPRELKDMNHDDVRAVVAETR